MNFQTLTEEQFLNFLIRAKKLDTRTVRAAAQSRLKTLKIERIVAEELDKAEPEADAKYIEQSSASGEATPKEGTTHISPQTHEDARG